MPRIDITLDDPRRPEITRLIEELDAYMASLYPAESNHLLDIDTLAQSDMRFFSARVDDVPQGCGALWLQDTYGEVKRIYVRPTARGLGLGKRILAKLEEEAATYEFKLMLLETGIHQPEALGLFKSMGFVSRGPYGTYPTDDPFSVFMQKELKL